MGSSALEAAVRQFELRALWPGAIAEALLLWTRIARGPQSASHVGSCPLCDRFYEGNERWYLERATAALPRRPARELRRMLEEVDREFLAKTLPNPLAPIDRPWWYRRCRD